MTDKKIIPIIEDSTIVIENDLDTPVNEEKKSKKNLSPKKRMKNASCAWPEKLSQNSA